MKLITSAEAIELEMSNLRNEGQSVGFVPTMGALHAGHIRLVSVAAENNAKTVASIFVNPLQFNNREDFINYPSTLEKDIPMLDENGCDLLFHPDYKQVYRDETARVFELGGLDEVMEGKFRPGHFQGVANVVYRFFEMIRPDKAYFGLKDYQQYLVIKNIVAPFFPGLEIIGVETVRDRQGLAMSSRNLRLTPAQYNSAVQVPEMMKEIIASYPSRSFAEAREEFKHKLESIPELRFEYLEVAGANDLCPAKPGDDPASLRIFVAFYAGNVRLIDNMSLMR